MPAPHRPAALVLAALLAACSKSEPPPQKPATPAIAPKPAEPVAVPPKGEAIDDKLKERLARQEAAAKMFEGKVLQPAPPKAPEPPPPAVKAAPQAAPAAAAPRPEPPKAEPPRQEPPKAEPTKGAARTDPPKAASPAPPSAPPAAPPPRTDLAAAKPSSAPEGAAPRLVSKVDPDFPREAVVAGVDQGTVRARMTLDGSGNVTRVDVLDSNPRRVFDRAVVRALSQWRYNDGAAGRTVDMEIAFKR